MLAGPHQRRVYDLTAEPLYRPIGDDEAGDKGWMEVEKVECELEEETEMRNLIDTDKDKVICRGHIWGRMSERIEVLRSVPSRWRGT